MKSLPSYRALATMVAILLLTLPISVAAKEPASRPCILLITADDMNCDSVGAFGGRVPGTTRTS